MSTNHFQVSWPREPHPPFHHPWNVCGFLRRPFFSRGRIRPHRHNLLCLGISDEIFLRASINPDTRNAECKSGGNSEPGCGLEWCDSMPALTVWQLFGGIIIGSIGYPYAVAITQSLFSKIIGPRPQVRLTTLLTRTVFYALRTFCSGECTNGRNTCSSNRAFR